MRDGGYDISDYRKVNPNFGSIEDFETLVNEAHKRGLRIVIDLVMNHTSDAHPWFQAARKDRHSKYHDYYVWSDTDQKYRDARIIFLDSEKSNWTWNEETQEYYWHRFYFHQPDLNYDNPAVLEEMLEIVDFWLAMGIDGFRVDAVPYLIEREGTNCENLPETHQILKRLRAFVEEKYTGRVLVCEANQWPRDVVKYLGEGDEFQVAFNFPLMPRIFMALKRADSSPIQWAMEQLPAIPENCQWGTFLRNHDELTLEMVTEEERQFMWVEYAEDRRQRLNLGIRRRLTPLLDNDRRKIELAHSLLFRCPVRHSCIMAMNLAWETISSSLTAMDCALPCSGITAEMPVFPPPAGSLYPSSIRLNTRYRASTLPRRRQTQHPSGTQYVRW